MKVDKLVRMANQIAMNLEFGSNNAKAADSVADHLTRFWAPSMRAAIIEYYRQGGEELTETAALAVAKLAAATAAA